MAIEQFGDYLFNSGSALVLHGTRDLTDADLAGLSELSDEERAAITCVVLSDTGVSDDCFRYLAYLPNLKSLYANKTRLSDRASLEHLPKSIESINFDDTNIGDMAVAKLKALPHLRSVRLRNTCVTDLGAGILATIPSLNDCHTDGSAVSAHACRQISNAVLVRNLSLAVTMAMLFQCLRFALGRIVR